VGAGEGYALRDDQGRVLHQAGAVPAATAAVVRVPLAAALLPGWDVAAFLPAAPPDSASSTVFLGVSVLLVGIFVAAILSGGGLLLRQARRSEEEAAQKTSFVANVSHEFKTPLTTIRLYAELLEQGRVRDASQGGEYLRTIGRETQRLARLVNNVLDFSRLEQGRKKFQRETLDLSATLAQLLDAHAPRLAEGGLELKRKLPVEAVSVLTDRDAVEQIVLNLLDNACKYAAEGREVSVALRLREGGGAEISVGDRGPGVPVAHRERIFEKFHRVDETLTAEKGGAGLGLSIARQLARGLGGELRYEPREGGGAEFIFELP
jgi:signal transduction histidine kinase